MRKILLLVFCISFVFTANAQLDVTDANTNFTINFDSTVSGVNFGQYDASDIVPSPVSGDLDSNAWAIAGMSSGDVAFDASSSGGDYGRGPSSGAETGGGLYAFQVGGASDVALGWQPTGSDFAPGSITFKITNNTGETVTRFSIDYELWVLNNENRSSSEQTNF